MPRLRHCQFNQTVRVRGISIQCSQESQAPKLIKIVVNNPNIGFDEVQDASEPQVAQVIELDAETATSGNLIPLRFVRFQSVLSLHVSTIYSFDILTLHQIPVPRYLFHPIKGERMKPGLTRLISLDSLDSACMLSVPKVGQIH